MGSQPVVAGKITPLAASSQKVDASSAADGIDMDALATACTNARVELAQIRFCTVQAVSGDLWWRDDGTTPVDGSTGGKIAEGLDMILALEDLSVFQCVGGVAEFKFYV